MTALLPCLVFSRKAWRALLYCCCCIIDGNLANAYRCLVSYTRCCTSIPDTWYPNITLLLDYVQQYSIIRTCEYEWSTHLSFVFYQRECTRCQVPGKTAVPGTCCTRYLVLCYVDMYVQAAHRFAMCAPLLSRTWYVVRSIIYFEVPGKGIYVPCI